MSKVTQAFVYKWIHKPTGMWYIGSRTAKGCHINDGYICSSKIVKPMILEKPEEWSRFILHTGTPGDMRKMETKLLVESNAKKNMMSFNRNNADGVPSGGRHKGSSKKIKAKTVLDALGDKLGKPYIQEVVEHYLRAIEQKDKASIIFYERIFKSKEMVIKLDGKVLYDGRK